MVLLSNLRWKTRLQGHSKYSVAAGVTGILLYVTVGLLRFSFFFSIYLLIYLAVLGLSWGPWSF